MSIENPELGKLDQKSFSELIAPYLPKSSSLILGPKFGSDYAAVSLSEGQVLVTSTDPLALSPELGWKRSARLALQVVVADVAVSGIPPNYLVVNWNLPLPLEDRDFREIWREFCSEAESRGILIIGGHTGRYSGLDFPIAGSATVFGTGAPSDLLMPTDVEVGDQIVLFNEPAAEAAGIFSYYFPDRLSSDLGSKDLNHLQTLFEALDPITDFTHLSALPEMVMLHDLAEGGLLGGLQEVVSSAGLGTEIERSKIDLDPVVKEACNLLRLDPLQVTSVGAGLGIVRKGKVSDLLKKTKARRIKATPIGSIISEREVAIGTESGRNLITEPIRDRFWNRLEEFSK